jgi:hypothetical protein
MALDKIPNTQLFTQRDVRETPASTATASAVGLTGEPYVLVGAGGADLTAERTLTAGEGINLSDGGAGTTITIDGESASDTNKGIATFQATDFTVTTGDVALKAVVVMSVDGDSGTATPAVHNIDILGGDGITTAGANNDITITNSDHTAVGSNTTHRSSDGSDHSKVGANETAIALNTTHRGSAGTDHSDVGLNNTHRGLTNEHLDWTGDQGATNIHTGNYTNTTYTAGEGLDLAGGVFSGENATTTNKGIASFNTNDFTVSSGAVSLKNKTSYWSAPGCAIQNIATVDQTGSGLDETNSEEGYLPVYLPHGAIVTGFQVTGAQNSATVCTLYRKLGSTVGDAMASAEIAAAEDTSISNATIDNSTYAYFVEIVNFDGRIDWVRIKYTTDYI